MANGGSMSKRRKDSPKAASAFGPTIINDPKLIQEPSIFFVNNVADKDNPLIQAKARVLGLKIQGKREGYGMPGGGVKEEEDLESDDEGIFREYEGESGLKVLHARRIDLPVYKLLLIKRATRLETEQLIRQAQPYFERDRPAIPVNWDMKPNFRILENEIPIYQIQAQWEGSFAQKIFINIKSQLIASGEMTQEEINSTGLTFDFNDFKPSLDPVSELGLSIEEAPEIKGFALFPIKYVMSLLEDSERKHGLYWQEKEAYDQHLDPTLAKPQKPEDTLIYYAQMRILRELIRRNLLKIAA